MQRNLEESCSRKALQRRAVEARLANCRSESSAQSFVNFDVVVFTSGAKLATKRQTFLVYFLRFSLYFSFLFCVLSLLTFMLRFMLMLMLMLARIAYCALQFTFYVSRVSQSSCQLKED